MQGALFLFLAAMFASFFFQVAGIILRLVFRRWRKPSPAPVGRRKRAHPPSRQYGPSDAERARYHAGLDRTNE